MYTHAKFILMSLFSVSSSLEMLDKVEPPSIPEGYAMSVAFSALLDLVRGITSMIERELSAEEEAAAEFRETHPDQEWQPQTGETGEDGRRMAAWFIIVQKNVIMLDRIFARLDVCITSGGCHFDFCHPCMYITLS